MLQKNESKIYYSKYLTGHYWFFLYSRGGVPKKHFSLFDLFENSVIP